MNTDSVLPGVNSQDETISAEAPEPPLPES